MKANRSRTPTAAMALGTLVGALLLAANAQAQIVTPEGTIESLVGEPVPPVIERISGNPLVPNFVKNQAAAIELGKALFWDQQAGSDGQACGSCYFNAGMDNRVKNQLSPGLLGGNGAFDPTDSGGAGGPNYTLKAGDFPFHRLADPNDRNSVVEFDTDDVASSQGVFPTDFVDVVLGSENDDCTVVGAGVGGDPVGFEVGGINVRRVEPRNTPTVIIAVFNFRNFWDGRANNIFSPDSKNGNVFGRRDPNASILEKQPNGDVNPLTVEFTNSSLASQAAGPPLSPFEMSCAGRTFPKIGKKLLSLTPLGLQLVASDDSVLASLSDSPAPGLTTTRAYPVNADTHYM